MRSCDVRSLGWEVSISLGATLYLSPVPHLDGAHELAGVNSELAHDTTPVENTEELRDKEREGLGDAVNDLL